MDQLPVTRTKFDQIDDSQLVATTFDSDTQGVILKNLDTTGTGFRFAYVPVTLTATYRAVCLKTLPFPRKAENLQTIKYFKQEFHRDIEAEQRSLALSFVSALPNVPDDLDLSSVKEAVVYDSKTEDELTLLESQIPEIIKSFSEIQTGEDMHKIALMHNNWIRQVNRIEKKLTNPLTNPLILIDEKWQTDIKSNSRVQVFKKNDEINTVILKVEVPAEFPQIPNKQFVPLPIFNGKTDDYEDDIVTVPTRRRRPSSTTVSTSTTITTTTTVSPTPYTITTSRPFSTSTPSTTTTKPDEEGWGDWFTKQWARVKSFTEFLNMSLKLPSAYDIICLILITIHSIILSFMLFFRKPRRVVVRKMDWKAVMPKFKRRHSDSSIVGTGSYTRPSAPTETVIEMQARDVRKKKRQVQWIEDSDEESMPFQPQKRVKQIETTRTKKPAPPPPYPMYPSVSRKREGKIYLPKSLPLYLVESDNE
jgi:hypothetical protein